MLVDHVHGQVRPRSDHPDKTYEVTLDREGWPVREIDSGTGEIVTFDRGPEKVFGQIPMSRRRLLTLHAAAERADARLGWR